jgi:hypothetical protein
MPARAYGSGLFEVETLVDAGRDAAGNMMGNIIGEDKCKLNCKYPPLTPAEANIVFSAFHRPTGGKFIVWAKFWDVRVNQVVVKQMYVGNRSGNPIMWGKDITPSAKARYLNVQANLIEV